MKTIYKRKRKVTIAYGVIGNPNEFHDVVEMFSPCFGWEIKKLFFEEINFKTMRPKYLAVISKMIRAGRVHTLAIPAVSRWLFASHTGLFKLWILAQRYKVRFIFVEKINFEVNGNQQRPST